MAIAASGALLRTFSNGPLGGVGEVQGAVGTPEAAASPAATPRRTPSLAPAARPSPVAVPTPSPVPTPAPPGTLTGYRSPLANGRLTLPFGPSPWGSRVVEGETFHDGIDLATFCGDRVVAAHAGTVLAAGRRYDRYMGWIGDLRPYLGRLEKKQLWATLPIVVVVDDGNGYRSVYAHFGKVVVKKGQAVKAGQLLGYEGAHRAGVRLPRPLRAVQPARDRDVRDRPGRREADEGAEAADRPHRPARRAAATRPKPKPKASPKPSASPS